MYMETYILFFEHQLSIRSIRSQTSIHTCNNRPNHTIDLLDLVVKFNSNDFKNSAADVLRKFVVVSFYR